jgi:hypothetical protein
LVLAASILLTPWPIDSQTWLPAPAIIATLFNVLSGYTIEALKSLLPILFVGNSIASFVMWFKQRRHIDSVLMLDFSFDSPLREHLFIFRLWCVWR